MAWPETAEASSHTWPVIVHVRSISILDVFEGLTMSKLAQLPGHELEPVGAGEKTELAGVALARAGLR